MSFIVPDKGPPIYFDLTVSEMHEGTVTVTEKPVERGAPVADNARVSLDKLTLVVFVTNSPTRDRPDGSLGMTEGTVKLDVPRYKPPFTPTPGAVFKALGDGVRSLFADPPDDTQTVRKFALEDRDSRQELESALRTLQNDKIFCQVITAFRSYTSMFLESFEMPIDEDSGDGAEVTLNFRQIRIVDTRLVNAPIPTQARGQKAKDKGHKDPKAVAAQKQSVALKLAQAAGIPVPGAGAIP
jgi:hypothetical protein